MIKMVLKRFDRTVELNVPAEYEHVLLCLWRLVIQFYGIQRNVLMRSSEAIREDVIDHCIMHPAGNLCNIGPMIEGQLEILGPVIHQMVGKYIAVIEYYLEFDT